MDKEKNSKNEQSISTGKTKVLVIPTNEELAIAQETDRILKEKHEKELKEKEIQKTRMELEQLNESQKARIAIIWSENKNVPHTKLLNLIEEDLRVKLSSAAFEELLTKMGLS